MQAGKWANGRVIVSLFIFFVFLVACRTLQETTVPIQTAVSTPTPLSRTSTAVPSSTAVSMPSFSALNPATLRKEDPGMVLSPTPTLPPTLAPTETPTLMPTFTPPPLPANLPATHYWLDRPVASSGVAWTDKSYPYGSTQNGRYRPHHGVEFYVASGTQILATADGTVVVAGDDLTTTYGPQTDFYGKLVVIQLDTPYAGQAVFTLYGHLSEVLVSSGQHVSSGELIALSGDSGVALGPHLHFEVRLGQNSYASTRNPLLWLKPFPGHGTVAGRVAWPSGELVREAQVVLRRVDAPPGYLATTTYAGNSLNADGNLGENFVLDDVPAGFYEVTVQTPSKKFTTEVWIFDSRTSFVDIMLNW